MYFLLVESLSTLAFPIGNSEEFSVLKGEKNETKIDVINLWRRRHSLPAKTEENVSDEYIIDVYPSMKSSVVLNVISIPKKDYLVLKKYSKEYVR